jgi:hypothetical protein
MTAVRRDGSGSPPRLRGDGCSQRGASPAANQTSGGWGRVGFILAAAAYGVWLGFLAVLAVIQKVR